MTFCDLGNGAARIDYGAFAVEVREGCIAVFSAADFVLENRIGQPGNHLPDVLSCGEKDLWLCYGGAEYGIALRQGTFESPARARSENGKIEAAITVRGKWNGSGRS